MTRRTTRRRFIQESTLAGLGFWAAGGVALAREGKAANDQLNFACIGVGGKGSSDVDGASKVGKIIALCDIDDNTLNAKAAEPVKKGSDELKFPGAQKFNDYREMLDKLGDKIDGVTVSTPDHTHAPASIMAMKKGKGVYCQKPLTHSVAEAREMRETAAKMKVATQMGNQGSAENGLREAIEVIQSGAIGAVRRCRCRDTGDAASRRHCREPRQQDGVRRLLQRRRQPGPRARSAGDDAAVAGRGSPEIDI